MKIKIAEQIAGRISELLEATPGLVAQLAAQYSQDAFRKKAFDGHPWPQNRDPRSSSRHTRHVRIPQRQFLGQKDPARLRRRSLRDTHKKRSDLSI